MSWSDCIDHKQKSRKYGRTWRDGKRFLLHRLIYEQYLGRELTSKEFVLHQCDNPRCININHLITGDAAANNRDRAHKFRNNKSKLTKDNIQEIRQNAHLTLQALATKFNVSESLISRILLKEIYKFVD